MSNLIIMPGNEGSDSPVRKSYAGRCLAINPDMGKVFQTFGFFLGPKKPFGTVPENADMGKIQNAVLTGQLIDVTDQPRTGLKTDEGSMSAVQTEASENCRKVFIGVGRSDKPSVGPRQLYVAIPETEGEEKAMLMEIERHGRIDGVYEQLPTSRVPDFHSDVSIGGIQIQDIEPRKPIPVRGKITLRKILGNAAKQTWSELRAWWSR